MFYVKNLHALRDKQSIEFVNNESNKSITVSVLLEFINTDQRKYPALISFEFYDSNAERLEDISDLSYSKEYGYYKYIASVGYIGKYDFTEVINLPRQTKVVTCKLYGLYCENLKILDHLKIFTVDDFELTDTSNFYYSPDFIQNFYSRRKLIEFKSKHNVLLLGNILNNISWPGINIQRIRNKFSLLLSKIKKFNLLILTNDCCKYNCMLSVRVIVNYLKKKKLNVVFWDLNNDVEGIYDEVSNLVDAVFCSNYDKVSLYKNYNKNSFFLPNFISKESLSTSSLIYKNKLHPCLNFDDVLDSALCFEIPFQLEKQYNRIVKILFGDFIQNEKKIDFNYKISQQLYRKVLHEHCFIDRLNFIANKVNMQPFWEEPLVVILAVPKNKLDLRILLEHIKRQNYIKCIPYIYTRSEKLASYAKSFTNGIYRIISSFDILKSDYGDKNNVFICHMDSTHYYGSYYVNDLVLGHKISLYNIIVPSHYYLYENHTVLYKCETPDYSICNHFEIFKSLISLNIFESFFTKYEKKNNYCFNAKCFSTSTPSFIENGSDLSLSECIHLAENYNVFDEGVNLADIGEQNGYIKPRNLSRSTEFSLFGDQLFQKFAKNTDSVFFDLNKHTLNIQSFYKNDANYKYFYAKNMWEIKDLSNINDAVIEYEGEGDLKVFFVLVYLDSNNQKISHNILDIDVMSRCYLPPKTSKIKLGLKIQGRGNKQIKSIKIVKSAVCLPFFSSKTLFVSKYYASYSDLYKNGFIHQRLKEYKRLGLKFDFFEYCGESELKYREFDGINIITGNLATLSLILNCGYIRNVCVHFPYPDLLSILVPYLNKINLVCWFHGTEIDSWQDRQCEFIGKTEEQIKKIKNVRDNRQNFYRGFLPNHEFINYIFVSKDFKNRTIANLSISPQSNFFVIHNYINSKIFIYKKRNREQLFKVLVIRPFSSPRYANDVVRDAILALSTHKCFKQFHFEIYGDGILFDECTNSIKEFENVVLHKNFVPQTEIAHLHKKFGVMLVPTRGDTQGVTRDEAMSSGLIVITTNVQAIPEFTDDSCAVVVPEDDYKAIASKLIDISFNYEKYLLISANSNKKVQKLCNFNSTILREYSLITTHLREISSSIQFSEIDVIVYCDVNPNIFDGSSVWLHSVATIISKEFKTLVLVKNNLNTDKNVIKGLDTSENLIVLEPINFGLHDNLDKEQVVEVLSFLENKCVNVFSLVIRGYEIAYKLAKNQRFKNKMYSYFSAFYKPGDSTGFYIPSEKYELINTLFSYSKKILFQTKFIAEEFLKFYQGQLNYSILPPGVPDDLIEYLHCEVVEQNYINIGYAGKFYPNWGVEELVDWSQFLINKGLKIKVHLVISKYFNSPEYKKSIQKYLKQPFVVLYEGKDRYDSLSIMKSMDFVWCWRPKWFEFTTLEYSMKLIENLYCENICLMQPSKVNIDLVGKNYDYFIQSKSDFFNVLKVYQKTNNNKKIFSSISLNRFVLSNINII